MGAGCSVDRWGLVAEGAVPSAVVVVLLPVADHHACLRERPEHVDVQALVPNAAVERLDVSVAPGLPRWDEVQAGAWPAGPNISLENPLGDNGSMLVFDGAGRRRRLDGRGPSGRLLRRHDEQA